MSMKGARKKICQGRTKEGRKDAKDAKEGRKEA
jgi:hypothetical protein